MKEKPLKYRDLPWELKNRIDFTYGHIQKAQNPTVKHILEKLEKYKKKYLEEGAEVTAGENREAINKIENYIQSINL